MGRILKHLRGHLVQAVDVHMKALDTTPIVLEANKAEVVKSRRFLEKYYIN